jgi:glycerophosphoryl diester phosphodiesterase
MHMKIIGHRGARGLAPENTLASMQKAVEHKVDMIEFDVRVTSDRIPIIHHDPEIRINYEVFIIAKSTYDELKAAKQDLATLAEVLGEFKNMPLYIEVKPRVKLGSIVKTIKSYDNLTIYLASKSQKTLRELHKALPEVPKIVIEPWSGVRAHYRAAQVNTRIVAMNQRWMWWGFIRGFKNNGWQLYAYTINNPKKARRWARWGLAGVVTDYPDRFQR